MGWKAFNLFATNTNEPYLTSFPQHQPEKARTLLSLLGGTYEPRGLETLENALYPNEKTELYVGTYDHAVVLGSIPLTEQALAGHVPPAVHHVQTILPGSRALVVALHSVVDLFGYAWYENAALLRAHAGNADDGVFLDVGEPLPLEQKLREFDETTDGEELVMELCRPFLGCRLDEFDHWELQMELFTQR